MDEWESAAGVPCADCGRESFRLTNGRCDRCQNKQTDQDILLNSGRQLTEEDMDRLWTPGHQAFLEKLTRLAKKTKLKISPAFNLREWVLRVYSDGQKCVCATDDESRSCPCSDPLEANCPLLR